MENKHPYNAAFENVVVIKSAEEEFDEIRELNIKIAKAHAEYEKLKVKVLPFLLKGDHSQVVKLEDGMAAKEAEIENLKAELTRKYAHMKKEEAEAILHATKTHGFN